MKAEASTMTSAAFVSRSCSDDGAAKTPGNSKNSHHIEAYSSLNTYDKLGALGLNSNTGAYTGGGSTGGAPKTVDTGVGGPAGLTTADQLRPQQVSRAPAPAPAPPAPLQETALLPPPSHVADELKAREAWVVGSIIEVYSASAGRWYVAQVCQVTDSKVGTSQMLTVQFMGDNMQFLQKTMPRSDVQVAPFGRNTRLMPPDFQKVASESRPGQFSYQDTTTGVKYQTKELAWQNYFIRALKAASNKVDDASHAKRKSETPIAPDAASQLLSSDLYAGAKGPDPVLAQSLLPSDQVFAGSGGARNGGVHQYPKQNAATGYNAGTGEQPIAPQYGSAAAGTGDRSRSLTRAEASSRARTQSVNRAELMQHANSVSQAGSGAPVHARPSAAGVGASPAKTMHDVSSGPYVASSPSAHAPASRGNSVSEHSTNLPPPQRQSFAGLQPSPSSLPPGYGVSFAVGADAGVPAYLLNGGSAKVS